jgi:hypothetical protein
VTAGVIGAWPAEVHTGTTFHVGVLFRDGFINKLGDGAADVCKQL